MWRLLQSKAKLTDKDCEAQKVLLHKVDEEEIPMMALFKRGRDMIDLIVAGKDPMEPPAEEVEAAPAKEELSPA